MFALHHRHGEVATFFFTPDEKWENTVSSNNIERLLEIKNWKILINKFFWVTGRKTTVGIPSWWVFKIWAKIRQNIKGHIRKIPNSSNTDALDQEFSPPLTQSASIWRAGFPSLSNIDKLRINYVYKVELWVSREE